MRIFSGRSAVEAVWPGEIAAAVATFTTPRPLTSSVTTPFVFAVTVPDSRLQ